MQGLLQTLGEFGRVAFSVALWLAILAGFAGGLDKMERGGGALAGGALVAAVLLYRLAPARRDDSLLGTASQRPR